MAITGAGFDTAALNDYLYLLGRSTGQVLGAGAHTSGSTYDLAIEGRLLLGENLSGVGYTAGRVLDVRQLALNATTQINLQFAASGFTGTASGIWRALQLQLTGTAGWTGGTAVAMQGMFFTASPTLPAGVTVTEITGAFFQTTPAETNSGTQGYNTVTGFKGIALGPSAANAGHTGTLLRGLVGEISNRAKNYTTAIHVDAAANAAPTGTTTHWSLFSSSTVNWSINSTNFYALRFEPTSFIGATNIYGIKLNDKMTKSVIGHATTIAGLTDPIHGLDSQASAGLKITANKIAVYAAANETFIPCNAVAAGFAVNLPTAVGIAGRMYIIKKIDATVNAVAVTPAGAETIDGGGAVALIVQWAVLRVVSDGANWLVW